MAFRAALVGLPLLVTAAFVSPDDHVVALQVQVEPTSNPMVKKVQVGGYVRLTRDEDYIRRVLTQNGYEDRDIDTLAGFKGHVTKVVEMPGDGLVGVPGAKRGLTLWLPEELLRVVTKDEALSFPSFEKVDSAKVIGVGDDVIYKGQKLKVYNIDKQGRLGVESLDGSGLSYVAKDSVALAGPAVPNSGTWNSPDSFAKQSGLGVGDLVRVTRQESKLRSQFAHDEFKFDEKMMQMLGKNFRIMAVDREKHAIALPAPDGSGKKWWFHESLVKPAEAPVDPNDLKELQEYNIGETVRLTTDGAAVQRHFPANFVKIAPLLGQFFDVKAVNNPMRRVALSNPNGEIFWVDTTLVERQQEQSPELHAPTDIKAGEIVHVIGNLPMAKQNFAAISQPWNGDVSQMLGHEFKVLGVSGDGRLVALPDKEGLHKIWVPSTLIGRVQLPGRATNPKSPVVGKRGLRPQWEDLKAVWLEETKTGNEGCASRRVKEAGKPIWEDVTRKLQAGQIKTGPKTALLEVENEDVPWADLTWSDESKLGLPHPTLAGPIAEGLMKCVIRGFPSDIRLKAAAYLSAGGGANRRELPADLRPAASMQYMFSSMAAQEDKHTFTDLHRLEEGKAEYKHKKEAAKMMEEARAEEQAKWMKEVEKAAIKSRKTGAKSHKTTSKSKPRTKTMAKSKVKSKTSQTSDDSPVMEESADEVPVLKVQ